jgi:hypothetical protein
MKFVIVFGQYDMFHCPPLTSSRGSFAVYKAPSLYRHDVRSALKTNGMATAMKKEMKGDIFQCCFIHFFNIMYKKEKLRYSQTLDLSQSEHHPCLNCSLNRLLQARK